FGRISVRSSQVFFATRHSFGLVNLKPFRPGHVLVVSRRPVQRMSELTAEEVSDIFTNAQTVCRVVEKVWNAEAVTVAVQDGEAAGQTVPHFHVHLIPRRTGDYPHNDDVYRDLEDK
ncbi:HIT-like protein, partial [Ramicandelaber brevisporus]